MRAIYLFIAFSVLLFQSCNSNDDADTSQNDFVNGAWNLLNVSGGFAGIDENFEEGTIQWTFNSKNGKLKVVNKSTNSSIYSSLATGTYPFSISAPADAPILYINDEEYGGIGELKNGILINQNIMANGSGADGFVLKFQK